MSRNDCRKHAYNQAPLAWFLLHSLLTYCAGGKGMPTDPKTLMRRHLRFTRYLPVQCTILSPEETEPRALAGITRNVNADGLEILLPEALPVRTMVSVRVAESDPLPGHIVSVEKDKGISTPPGDQIPSWRSLRGSRRAIRRTAMGVNPRKTGPPPGHRPT